MHRPSFELISSAEEFNQWYWKKDELVKICQETDLPYRGSKETLRQRISYALENKGKVMPNTTPPKKHSHFNWAKAELMLSTVITDNVSFGPNFRRFMKSQIGNKFSCHGDFMEWVKSNSGKTLQDAVDAWNKLEDRKKDPNFKRKIAAHNRMNQYIRDFLEANPTKSFDEALKLWHKKKKKPVKNGMVTYEKGDEILLKP